MAEILKGIIEEWDPKRGFGFLKCGEQRIIVHVKDFVERAQAPMAGDRFAFVMGEDAKGRACAQKVEALSARSRLKALHFVQLTGLLMLPLLAVNAIPIDSGLLGGWILVTSVISWFLYRRDKESAQKGAWRIRESTLHLLELAGGWPGAFLAQRKLRHKTAKGSFLLVFWAIVMAYQLLALDYLIGWRITKGLGAAIKPVPQQHRSNGFREPAPSGNGIIPME